MYSNEWMLRIVGNSSYGDALEKAFLNAAPGAVNRSFSGHVYFQSPNLVPSTINHWPFNTPSADTGNFSVTDPRWVESWYHTPPCCTGNQVRMLPNYIHHMWWGSPDGGLVATMHGPSSISTVVNGVATSIVTTTDYPFSETISFAVTTAGMRAGGEGNAWTLRLRIPHWCTQPSLALDGKAVPIQIESGYAVVSHTWQGTNTVSLVLPMSVRATKRVTFANGNQNIGQYNWKRAPWAKFPGQNGTAELPFCVVEYGPLTFALPLENGSPQHVSGGEYRYGIVCDAATMQLKRSPGGLKAPFDWPLSQSQGGLTITAKAAVLTEWGDVWALPKSPLKQPATDEIELIPYGCAKQFHIR